MPRLLKFSKLENLGKGNFEDNGFFYIGNILFCFGKVQLTAGKNKTIFFPKSFTTKVVNIQVSIIRNSWIYGDKTDHTFINEISLEKFNVISGPDYTLEINWLAIGY